MDWRPSQQSPEPIQRHCAGSRAGCGQGDKQSLEPWPSPQLQNQPSAIHRTMFEASIQFHLMIAHSDCEAPQNSQYSIHPTRSTQKSLRLRGGRSFRRIHELLNLRSFLVDLGHMLRSLPLVDVEFRLSAILLANPNIVLPKTIVSIWKIGIELQRTLVLRDRLVVFMLVSIEISQLNMRFGKRRIESNRLLQQRLNLTHIKVGIFCALSLP